MNLDSYLSRGVHSNWGLDCPSFFIHIVCTKGYIMLYQWPEPIINWMIFSNCLKDLQRARDLAIEFLDEELESLLNEGYSETSSRNYIERTKTRMLLQETGSVFI